MTSFVCVQFEIGHVRKYFSTLGAVVGLCDGGCCGEVGRGCGWCEYTYWCINMVIVLMVEEPFNGTFDTGGAVA